MEFLSEVKLGQEFFINSQELQDKVDKLLPSQGGAGAGFDLSASTQIIPIIDLTESAEGSNVRQDLQTASSFASTLVDCTNSDQLITTTTGYFQLEFAYNVSVAGSNNFVRIYLDDGVTEKEVFQQKAYASGTNGVAHGNSRIVVFISAGKELRIQSNNASSRIVVCSHQIADIDGNLSNPI